MLFDSARARPAFVRLSSTAVLVASLLAGCAKSPPTLIDTLDEPQMGREELRARLYQYVRRFTSEIEIAVHDIGYGSDDLDMGRRALRWATSVVPAAQSAAFQADPAAGMIDSWALAAQQRDFFETGLGKDVFGEWQHIPIATAHVQLEEIQAIARALSPTDFDRMNGNVEEWVAENPIDNLLFNRQSTAPLTAAALGPASSSALSAVGSMSDEVRDLSARISVYNEIAPKTARWQAALLLLSQEAGGVSFIEMLRDIERYASGMEDIVIFLDTLKVLLDSIPQLVSSEREAVMTDITRERVAVMNEISEMLTVTLAAIDQERLAVMDGVTQERMAALQELDAIAARLTEMALDQAEVRIENAIDHLIWRLVQVLAVVAVLVAVAGFFVLRYLAGRRMPTSV
jgi:hypothetical protein